jgi:ribosome biogenesis GTPase
MGKNSSPLRFSFDPWAAQGLTLARVVAVHRDRWEVEEASASSAANRGDGIRPDTSFSAELSNGFRREAHGPADLPVVGDWVAVERVDARLSLIRAIMPRAGLLARKRPGDVENDAVVEQAIAANIDVALLAMAADEDFSLRRLERYLTLAWDSGARPVVVLTKADLAGTAGFPSLDERLAGIDSVAFGERVIATSSRSGEGLAELRELLAPDTCAILLGSSGVGKSSLLNALAGEELQKTLETRDYDGKGRHATTSRRLVRLPWGAFLVDTPGLRELQLWGDGDSLADTFPDVQELALGCHFADCAHEAEPGCAVRAAVESGDLSPDRLESWLRLKRELAYLERKTDSTAARAERDKWKKIAKLVKVIKTNQTRH